MVKASQTAYEPIQRAIAQLRDVNARILGAILNGVDFKKEGYYYHYHYYYSAYSAYGDKEPAG